MFVINHKINRLAIFLRANSTLRYSFINCSVKCGGQFNNTFIIQIVRSPFYIPTAQSIKSFRHRLILTTYTCLHRCFGSRIPVYISHYYIPFYFSFIQHWYSDIRGINIYFLAISRDCFFGTIYSGSISHSHHLGVDISALHNLSVSISCQRILKIQFK